MPASSPSRVLFDKLLIDYPALQKYLQAGACISLNKNFERAIIVSNKRSAKVRYNLRRLIHQTKESLYQRRSARCP